MSNGSSVPARWHIRAILSFFVLVFQSRRPDIQYPIDLEIEINHGVLLSICVPLGDR